MIFDFQRLWERAEAEQLQREKDMPTEMHALKTLVSAVIRLNELGWRHINYCPKDGKTFLAIEAGSTRPGVCHYKGEWPKGSWWMEEAGDLWPSHPILWKSLEDESSN